MEPSKKSNSGINHGPSAMKGDLATMLQCTGDSMARLIESLSWKGNLRRREVMGGDKAQQRMTKHCGLVEQISNGH